MFGHHLSLLRDVDLTVIAPWTLLSASFVVLSVASLIIVVKRLYFHPLSKVPGPKLAATSGWYEFYYDIVRRGAYSHQVPDFHKKYGESIGAECALSISAFRSTCTFQVLSSEFHQIICTSMARTFSMNTSIISLLFCTVSVHKKVKVTPSLQPSV